MKYRLGPIEDFPEDEHRIVTVGRHTVGIYNVGGELYAVRNRCPHHGAPICEGRLSGTMLPSQPGELRYGLEKHILRCPWHAWEFDITTGRTAFGVDSARLVTYPVTIEDGQVTIEGKGLG